MSSLFQRRRDRINGDTAFKRAIDLFDRRDFAGAVLEFQEAVTLRSQGYGAHQPMTLVSQDWLGRMLLKVGKADEAVTLHRQVTTCYEDALGPDHSVTLISVRNLADALVASKQYNEAEKLLRRAIDGMRRQLGETHHDTLMTEYVLANLLLGHGKFDEAEKWYRQTAEGFQKTKGWDHEKTLSSKHCLAVALSELGQYDEAEKWFQQAIDAQKIVLGEEHRYTQESKDLLAGMRRRRLVARQRAELPPLPRELSSSPSSSEVVLRQQTADPAPVEIEELRRGELQTATRAETTTAVLATAPRPPSKAAYRTTDKPLRPLHQDDGDQCTVSALPDLGIPQEYTDSHFERVSTYLRNTGNPEWSKCPRLYTVLSLIGGEDSMNLFVKQSLDDMCFPFAASTLPPGLQPSAKHAFLEQQVAVFSHSKSHQLEKGGAKHVQFSMGEPLPFEVVSHLGHGAHGWVDKVMSKMSQKEYARKRFKRSGSRMGTAAYKSFLNEIGILKPLHHRHCISLFASYTDPGYFGLLMEPVGERNLAEHYAICEENLDTRSIMRTFFGCLSDAVSYLHASKVRHRDIKPQNIIIKGERVLITDFGIAYSWEGLDGATTTADSGKTMAYAAPEVMHHGRRSAAADVWSLGCVFLEMATVLKGLRIHDLKSHFLECGETVCFHANLDAFESWAGVLRARAPSEDNIAVKWASSMLMVEQEERPTAALLKEMIIDDSAECSRLYCGLCCVA